MINTENGHTYGRLRDLLRVSLPSGRQFDLAVVRECTKTRKWKPNTVWGGCTVLEEAKGFTLLPMKYVIRGVVLCPTFGSPASKGAMYYPMDMSDEDMFLRLDT